MKFEEALKKLSTISEELESDTISLEKAIKRYQEGMVCAKECMALLEKAEKKIQICIKDKKGTIKLKSFKKNADAGKDSKTFGKA